MLGKPSPGRRERMSARISRFQERVSSLFPRSVPVSPPSSPHSRLLENDAERRDILAPHAGNQLSPASASHRPSISNGSVGSATNHSSTLLIPPSPLSLPQEPLSTLRGLSRSSNHGMFSGSNNFSVSGGTFINVDIAADNFMKDLLQATIIGAEFDSSDRDPPPQCHPGTRLTIIQRCLDFIFECSGQGKLRWVVGAAGVGKSAVMQIVAEQAPDGVIFASVFLSINGRRDGTKTIATIAYQLAVKSEPYRRFIQDEITKDPSLLRKSLSVHFKRFIVGPFTHQHIFNPSDRFLVLIDGLDECDNPLTQRELLRLITEFCTTYPISPLVWIVASRPEPHITSFFDDVRVTPAYTREEIMIDSDEACQDVQRYLRAELKKIQLEYPTLKRKREWPSELEFTQVATAAGGLFAYASTVVRYIGDPHFGDPAAQLHRVLEVIDAGGKDEILRRDHPMTQLDALYTRILSSIPDDVRINTRKLLLLYRNWRSRSFRMQCNIVGLTEDAAYGAVRHLRAVARIPEPEKADEEPLEYLHKSFEDFLFDFNRSGFFNNVQDDLEQLQRQTTWRIIEEVPDDGSDGMTPGESIILGDQGYVKGSPGLCHHITLSWPADGCLQTTDDELRLELYRGAMSEMCCFDGSMFCFHILTTRFIVPPFYFPFDSLRDSASDKFRDELIEVGRLKQVSLRALNYAGICGGVELRFKSPIGVDTEHSDPWISSCDHEKQEIEGLQQGKGWTTEFGRVILDGSDTASLNSDATGEAGGTDIPRFNSDPGKIRPHGVFNDFVYDECDFCSQRLARHFTNNPDEPATVFVDSTELAYVEFLFVDPVDEVSEWRYRFFHSGPPACANE